MMLNRTTGVSILQHPIFLAILFFFLAMGINLIGIDLLSLTSDECFSIYHAQMSPRLIYHHLSTGNNPPLHEWILHYWMGWFGDSAFSVRLPSAIFSSLTAALIFILGTQISAGSEKLEKEAGNTSIGGITALLFLASNYTTFLAHEARTYNLTMFLGVLSTICFVTAIRSGKTTHFLVYGLIGGLLCLSHFFGIWILLAQGSFWLKTNWRNPNALKKMGWAVLGFGIAFGWYVPNLWYRCVDSASQGTWVNPAPWDAPYFTLWKYLNTPIATIIAALLLLYLTINLAAKKNIVQKQNTQLILWLFALPFFGQWLLSLDHPFSIPMFTERYASITLPFLCLILAMALSGLREQYNQGLYRFALALFFSTILSGKNFTPPNQACAREVLQTAKVSLGKNWGKTPIVLEPYHSAFQLLYYLDHQRFQQYHPESVYPHLANQLQQSNVWILKTNKTLDSTGLSNNNTLAYLRFGTEKSVHTQRIEAQLSAQTADGGKITAQEIQLQKSLWGTYEISHEAKFWLIEKK
jgi:uncharacterized membrane protein